MYGTMKNPKFKNLPTIYLRVKNQWMKTHEKRKIDKWKKTKNKENGENENMQK